MRHTLSGYIVDFGSIAFCFVKVFDVIARHILSVLFAQTSDIRYAGLIVIKLFFALDAVIL